MTASFMTGLAGLCAIGLFAYLFCAIVTRALLGLERTSAT